MLKEDNAVKCRFLLPNGRCEFDKRKKCNFDPDELEYTDSLFAIDPEEVCGRSSIYGNRYVEITADDIEELKAGKVLCYVDEYGIFIKLKAEDENET